MTEPESEQPDTEEQAYYVYLLVSSDNSTYVGATVNLTKRLRQHNKELVGGAHATSSKVAKGEIWERALHVAGFPTWSAALQFEWRFKQLSRKFPKQMFPLERRLKALKLLVELDRPTTKAMAYSEWKTVPRIVIETADAAICFKKVFKTDINEPPSSVRNYVVEFLDLKKIEPDNTVNN